MKKWLPYIIGGALVVLLLLLAATNSGTASRRLDERITLKQQDKIPYGTRVARELLSGMFPSALLPYNTNSPGNWDSINYGAPNQAVILISDYFAADADELKRISEFVAEGNFVFIITRSASDDFANFFHLSLWSGYNASDDSLSVRLEPAAFQTSSYYTYPGQNYEGAFFSIDTPSTNVLGRRGGGLPNFIRLNKGRGSFFIHTSPLAFSNYFILHKTNVQYYQKVFSVLPKNVTTILWNDFYLEKPYQQGDEAEPSWLRALLSYPSFKWGLLTGAFTLSLYILLGMRRRQRMIPPHEKPKNDSLDFVKTLGRLYYDRRDHKNLATKMTAYFLDHVRSKYGLPTHSLDDDFTKALHFKSGYAEEQLSKIIASIETVQREPVITDSQLAGFHKQLEAFYQNT